MKNLIILSVISLFISSCKSSLNPDDLPKPLPERPKDNPENQTLTKEESDEMNQLKSEIITLANSIECNNAADWKSVGLGAKACGGPVEYIAYSNKIDEKAFLKKVEIYNQKSTEYNKKYNLTSDCMLVMQPENIVCENGKPVFK